MANLAEQPKFSAWTIACLAVILVFAVWWRGHTFAPSIESQFGVAPWPVVAGQTEPLDCDEALYAYMGQKMLEGERLYADLSENKPPLGYVIYKIAIALGGANELAIRIMPVPLILVTVTLVWWIGRRVGGLVAAVVASILLVLLSTDPYLYGNGAQLEQAINCFSVGALASTIRASESRHWRPAWMLVAGISLGLAMIVKQVAALHLLVLGVAVLLMPSRGEAGPGKVRSVLTFALGLGGVLGFTVMILFMQGVGEAAYEDIIRAGRALATDVQPEPNAPSASIRWLTGNADPEGTLPPPFGKTNYLVWWGTGSWPIWLVGLPSLIYLLGVRPTFERVVLVGWTVSTLVQVIAPGLYWAHYYLLPVPGLALVVGITLADQLKGGWTSLRSWIIGLGIVLSMLGFVAIQVRDYLLVPSEELTIRHKGGKQWVGLRTIGRMMEEQTLEWEDPKLLIWGWQSPLHFYAKVDAASRHIFINNLMRDFADRAHPVVSPRIDELVEDLRNERPDFVLVAYPPFPRLMEILQEGYLPTNRFAFPATSDGRGMWVRKDRIAELGTGVSRRPAQGPEELVP